MNLIREWDGILAGLLLLGAIALVFAEVILRGLFGASMMGVDQIASFLVIWSAFLGSGYAISRNTHIRVDLLVHFLPSGPALLLEVLVTLACLGFSIVLLLSGIGLLEESLLLGEVTSGFLRIPMWIPQMVMPLAGGMYVIRFAVHLVRVARRREYAPAEQGGEHVGGI